MQVEQSIEKLCKLASALPRVGCDWESPAQIEPPATTEQIDAFERLAGFSLPHELRIFLKKTGGIQAMSMHNGYWLGPSLKMPNINSSGIPLEIAGERVVAIATVGNGDAFLLAATGQVLLWNHETNRTSQIAADFAAFLRRIAEDWDAYINDATDWQFLA